ncbi:MAG: dTDP-glucose 4,6-dehydratase [Chloroflexi bacterium]|nr:dTDP-glucose 4,6-dehydratase [Chloroflexota bacterium]
MKLLVTGGAGFIGSNFVRHILGQHPDWQVTNLDKLTYAGNLENLADIQAQAGYRFVKGDIAGRDLVDGILKEGYDAVVNFAAESHVDRSILDASPFVDTNFKGAQVLLEGARVHGVGRFLQVSTDEVYGSSEEGYFTEESPLDPSSPYSASKAAADLMCLAYHRTHSLDVVVTRCTNNYGPYQFPEKLIPLVITNALEDKAIPVYGDGLYRRDWIHVLDHCRALEAVLLKGKAGRVYNIAGGQEQPNIELIKLILKALRKPEGLITFVKDRPAHDRRYAIDCSRIEKELGWAPRFNIGNGMADTVDWYLKNGPWWRNIKSGEYEKYYQRMYGSR